MCAKTDNSDSWSWCPEGTLQEYADRLRKRQRRVAIIQTSSIATFLLCTVGLTIWSVNQRADSEHRFGGIACPQVRESLAEYQAGTMPEDQSEAIRFHLQKCLECQEFMRNLKRDTASTALARPKNGGCTHCRILPESSVSQNSVALVSSH